MSPETLADLVREAMKEAVEAQDREGMPSEEAKRSAESEKLRGDLMDQELDAERRNHVAPRQRIQKA